MRIAKCLLTDLIRCLLFAKLQKKKRANQRVNMTPKEHRYQPAPWSVTSGHVPRIRRFLMIISAWWLQTSSKFSG